MSDLIQEEPVQTHMPHLQYRDRKRPAIASTSPLNSMPASSTPFSPASPAFSAVSTPSIPVSPGCSSSSCAARQPRDNPAVGSIRSARQSSAALSPLSSRTSEKPSKSKSSFFNFFSVKEPSQQAFEDYQRRMRAKGNASDGRTAWTGVPGVSSAKMPATVPKVNSNWDGVPQVIKLKGKEKKMGGQPQLGKYSRSIGTSRSDDSKSTSSSGISSLKGSVRPKPGSSRFDSGSSLGDLYGWESAGTANDIRDQLDTADVKGDAKGSLPTSRSQNTSFPTQPPQPPPVPQSYLDIELPPLPSALRQSSHEVPQPDVEIMPEPPAHWSSSAATSAEPSPVTPLGFFPITSTAQVGYFTDQHQLKPTTILIPARDEVIIRSAGVQILGPPASARRKEKKTQ